MASSWVRPLSSAILRKPSQAHMLPSRERDSSTASPAPSITPEESWDSLPLTPAQRTLRAIMPNQMTLIIGDAAFHKRVDFIGKRVYHKR